MTTTPTVDLDHEVRTYLELTERIEELQVQRATIIARLRTLPAGKHDTTYGVGVSVSMPSRSFNSTKAWALLTPEQRALCVSPDAKKIKAQLPPVLTEQCMDEGTGEPRVTIR